MAPLLQNPAATAVPSLPTTLRLMGYEQVDLKTTGCAQGEESSRVRRRLAEEGLPAGACGLSAVCKVGGLEKSGVWGCGVGWGAPLGGAGGGSAGMPVPSSWLLDLCCSLLLW